MRIPTASSGKRHEQHNRPPSAHTCNRNNALASRRPRPDSSCPPSAGVQLTGPAPPPAPLSPVSHPSSLPERDRQAPTRAQRSEAERALPCETGFQAHTGIGINKRASPLGGGHRKPLVGDQGVGTETGRGRGPAGRTDHGGRDPSESRSTGPRGWSE